MSEKIHRGKLTTPPDPTVVKYLIRPGIEADIRYRYHAFLDCNKAHVIMLARQGIIQNAVARAIVQGNNAMAAMGDAPTFAIDPNREDFYFNLESHLIEEVGIEIGGQQHTARSRNDLYATCARMAVRDAYLELCGVYNAMRETIIKVAEDNTDAVFAGYTHMQPSEPITFAHYCSAILNAMDRDYSRIEHCWAGLNLCPLGGGSMGSTTWPIDRELTSDLLGFDAPIDNSIDCVATRDYVTEILGALSIASVTISRFCQDLYVWATPDYGYVEVPDSCAVCSSIMPQKKNPWVLEHIKAKAAHIEGCYISALNVMKNVIYSHCEDMCGEAANYLYNGLAEMRMVCELMQVSVAGLKINKQRMLDNAKRNFCTVTELANYIVRDEKVSFRTAHDVVAQVVARMIESGKGADQIALSDVNPIFKAIVGRDMTMSEADIAAALDPRAIAQAKTCIGGTSQEQVKRQLANRAEHLAIDQLQLSKRLEQIHRAQQALKKAEQML